MWLRQAASRSNPSLYRKARGYPSALRQLLEHAVETDYRGFYRPGGGVAAVLLVSLHVPAKLVLAMEVAVAAGDSAGEAALDFVCALVLGQVGRLAEPFPADWALEGFVAGVDALVHGWEEEGRLVRSGSVAQGGWRRLNLLRALGYRNALWQTPQTRGFSLLWMNMCWVRACFAEKPLLHVGQI